MTARWLQSLFCKKYQRVTSRRSTAPLAVESLETRELPAASLTAALTPDGLLRVEGTDLADTIHVRQDAGRISVVNAEIAMATGVHSSVEATLIRKIEVVGLGGDDFIRMDQGTQAIALPTLLDGGAGNDILSGGARADAFRIGTLEADRVLDFGTSDRLESSSGSTHETAVAEHGDSLFVQTSDGYLYRYTASTGGWQILSSSVTRFQLCKDGTLYWLEGGSAGRLYVMPAGGNYRMLTSTVSQFQVSNDGTLYWLEGGSAGRLYMMPAGGNYRMLTSTVSQFQVSNDGTLYWLEGGSAGRLYVMPAGGNYSQIATSVAAFHVDSPNELFTLKRDGKLYWNGIAYGNAYKSNGKVVVEVPVPAAPESTASARTATGQAVDDMVEKWQAETDLVLFRVFKATYNVLAAGMRYGVATSPIVKILEDKAFKLIEDVLKSRVEGRTVRVEFGPDEGITIEGTPLNNLPPAPTPVPAPTPTPPPAPAPDQNQYSGWSFNGECAIPGRWFPYRFYNIPLPNVPRTATIEQATFAAKQWIYEQVRAENPTLYIDFNSIKVSVWLAGSQASNLPQEQTQSTTPTVDENSTQGQQQQLVAELGQQLTHANLQLQQAQTQLNASRTEALRLEESIQTATTALHEAEQLHAGKSADLVVAEKSLAVALQSTQVFQVEAGRRATLQARVSQATTAYRLALKALRSNRIEARKPALERKVKQARASFVLAQKALAAHNPIYLAAEQAMTQDAPALASASAALDLARRELDGATQSCKVAAQTLTDLQATLAQVQSGIAAAQQQVAELQARVDQLTAAQEDATWSN